MIGRRVIGSARRPGRRNDLDPICMGSHLDTQPTGGKFDGVLGVLGALEVLRTMHDMGYETNAPIEVVNWTNEEGSRFAPAMLASGVFAGAFTRDYAWEREDRDGKRFGDELERIGYRGPEPVGQRRIGAMFELHIEQGPILEAENKMIGVVTGVQGIRWYEVTVRGQSAHTGATPMHLRKDALVGAARMVERIQSIALAHAPDAVASVGLMEFEHNSRNVLPGEELSAGVRHSAMPRSTRWEMRWSPFGGQIGGLAKLGSGLRYAAISMPRRPYGPRPASVRPGPCEASSRCSR